MDKSQILVKLKERLAKERAAYEAAGFPDYVRLGQSRFFASARKQREISRKIAALETAISVLEEPFDKADIARGVLLGISDGKEDKDDLLQLAWSASLGDRLNACQKLFDASLPVFKKDILKHITLTP